MTNDFLLTIRFWLQTAWSFLTSFYFPGTNVTPASMILFGATAIIGFRFIYRIFGSGTKDD